MHQIDASLSNGMPPFSSANSKTQYAALSQRLWRVMGNGSKVMKKFALLSKSAAVVRCKSSLVEEFLAQGSCPYNVGQRPRSCPIKRLQQVQVDNRSGWLCLVE